MLTQIRATVNEMSSCNREMQDLVDFCPDSDCDQTTDFSSLHNLSPLGQLRKNTKEQHELACLLGKLSSTVNLVKNTKLPSAASLNGFTIRRRYDAQFIQHYRRKF